jgi:hypothetical protein
LELTFGTSGKLRGTCTEETDEEFGFCYRMAELSRIEQLTAAKRHQKKADGK